MIKNNKKKSGLSVFEDLFGGLDLSKFDFDFDALSDEMAKINLKDYVNVMPKIKGAFNKLSDEDKQSVVDSFNKVDEMFGNIFGTKTHKWTVEDFKDSNVSVSGCGNCDCENKACACGESCNENKNTTKDVNNNICDCKHCADDECPLREEDYEGDETNNTIASSLLGELADKTRDEDVAEEVARYIVETLTDKKRKNYVLHPRAKGVPAAVEVDIPNSILKKDDISALIIPTLIHDKVVERVGCVDCFLPSDDEGIKAYIVLEKI